MQRSRLDRLPAMKRLAGAAVVSLLVGGGAMLLAPEATSAAPKKSSGQTTPAKKKPPKVPTTDGKPNNSYRTVYCRGPFAINTPKHDGVVGMIIEGHGHNGKGGAGGNGGSLSPSYCSWADNPWGSGKARVSLDLKKGGEWTASAIAACAHDSECIVRITHVQQPRTGWGVVSEPYAEITTFPRGFPISQ